VIKCLGIEPWVRSFIILELEFQFERSLKWYINHTMQTKAALYRVLGLTTMI